jgi:hypothetical protein
MGVLRSNTAIMKGSIIVLELNSRKLSVLESCTGVSQFRRTRHGCGVGQRSCPDWTGAQVPGLRRRGSVRGGGGGRWGGAGEWGNGGKVTKYSSYSENHVT